MALGGGGSGPRNLCQVGHPLRLAVPGPGVVPAARDTALPPGSWRARSLASERPPRRRRVAASARAPQPARLQPAASRFPGSASRSMKWGDVWGAGTQGTLGGEAALVVSLLSVPPFPCLCLSPTCLSSVNAPYLPRSAQLPPPHLGSRGRGMSRARVVTKVRGIWKELRGDPEQGVERDGGAREGGRL